MQRAVEDAIKNYENVDSWKTIIFLYNAALKEVGTKLEILNEEFQHVHNITQSNISKPESRHRKVSSRSSTVTVMRLLSKTWSSTSTTLPESG